jgi:hypothetical protein
MQKFILAASLFLFAGGAVCAQTQNPFGPTEAEIKEAMQQPEPMRFTFSQLVLGAQEEEHQPPPNQDDPHKGMNDNPPEFGVPANLVEPKFEPSIVAGQAFGMIILVAGILGWIGLGLAVLIVEGKQTKQV